MKIPIHKIENFTDSRLLDVRHVPVVKKVNYFVDDTVSVDGDAPKKFIGIYDHELLVIGIRRTAKTGYGILLRRAISGIPLNLSRS